MTLGISHIAQQAFQALPSAVQQGAKALVDRHALRRREHKAEESLRVLASRLSEQCLKDVATLEDWERRRTKTLEALRCMLGLVPARPLGAVRAQCTGVVDSPTYRMEKWLLETSPALYVTANLYLPKELRRPAPCILYQNGHWPSLDGAKTGFQDRYLWYPENGIALLVIDPMGLGEIPGIHPGTNRLNRWNWISKGYTPAGVEVWNAMRALDWLQSIPQIDPTRIGATGISGGGVMTQYLAALDERVKVAVPSCSTFTIGHQVDTGLVPQQCDCTFYPNVFAVDFPEVLALIAPRPLLILGGRKDPIFPPAGFRAAFERTRSVYRLYEGSAAGVDRVRLVESDAGHTDPPNFLEETRVWMCRWLRVDMARDRCRLAPKAAPQPPAEVRVTGPAPTDAVNGHIDALWFPKPRLELPATTAAAEARRAALIHVLQSRVFRWFPQRDAPFCTRQRPGSGGYAGKMAQFGEYEFESEPDVPIGIRLLMPHAAREAAPTVLWVKGANENVAFPDIDEFHPLLRTHAVAILTPRFADRPLSPPDLARVERTAALLGRSIAAMRIWDTLRAIQWLREERGFGAGGITLYGRGENGILGLYAALLNAQVSHVALRDPPQSHGSGPAVPTILRDTDIEEIAGLLAPRRLTLLGTTQGAMPITHGWFQRLGASEHLSCQPSLAAAMQTHPPLPPRYLQTAYHAD